MTLKVNDKVRVVLSSYTDYSKSHFSNQETCSNFSPSDKEIKLGAEYSILKIKQADDGQVYYILIDSDTDNYLNTVHSSQVIPSPVEVCTFLQGDEVKFQMNLTNNDECIIKSLVRVSNTDDLYTSVFKVEKVLNDYYVFLSLNGEYLLFPIKWTDLIKI